MWRMDAPGIVRFGPFEADLRTGELRRNGALVRLQQQPFRLLRALVIRPGELVTRETLKAELWADGTYVAFDRGLTSAIRKVREALDERAESPHYIQTLPGRGYRFIAPVAVVPAPAPVIAPAPRVAPARLAAVAALMLIGVATTVRVVTPQAEHVAAARALADYACLLKSMGRVDEAYSAIERAHALAPRDAGITAQVGFYAHAARRYDEEFPMLTKAVRQDPTSAEAWLHLGLGYARRQQFDKALDALERASASHASDDRVRGWLGWVRAQMASTRTITS
jgi:DNA-binding winged helix-turn-helix (wHTH) protein